MSAAATTTQAATDVEMRTRIGGVELPNPVMTASGTAGHGAELAAYMDLAALGAVVVKSVSVEPWDGNPAPRLLPLAATTGMLNSVGLQNPGVGAWLSDELPDLARTGARVVASIWGFTADQFRLAAAAIAKANPAAIVAVEANISCPNIDDRRQMFAHSMEGVRESVSAAVEGLGGAFPLWVKLSPNVTDLAALAGEAVGAGADVLTLVNTVMGMAIDPDTGAFRLGGGGGGMSGPAVHPIAVRAVYECRAAMPGAPIIGVGGVSTGEDAAELIAAGADAVQVGTATFADPRAPTRVLAELIEWCRAHRVSKIDQLKGRAHVRQ
jgi:dihydroorotate dehydrogenase (NAD+) catalytic subunit